MDWKANFKILKIKKSNAKENISIEVYIEVIEDMFSKFRKAEGNKLINFTNIFIILKFN